MSYTRYDFAVALCDELGIDVSKANINAFLSWMQAEGNAGKFNPLNTTQEWPGATNFNSVGVKNYKTFSDGVKATARTLNYGADRDLYGYKPIRNRLRRNARAGLTLRAVENSIWGTGGLALRCLPNIKRYPEVYKNILIEQ